MNEPACKRTRHHSWDRGAVPGATCLGCGKQYAARGARAAGDRAQSFRAALGITDLPAVATSDPAPAPAVPAAAPAAPAAPAANNMLWPLVGRMGATAYVSVVSWSCVRAGRVPNDVDREHTEMFADGLAQQLRIWFPDTALTPLKQVFVAGVFIAGGAWIGAEKMIPEQQQQEPAPASASQPPVRASAPNGAPAAMPASTPTPMEADFQAPEA